MAIFTDTLHGKKRPMCTKCEREKALIFYWCHSRTFDGEEANIHLCINCALNLSRFLTSDIQALLLQEPERYTKSTEDGNVEMDEILGEKNPLYRDVIAEDHRIALDQIKRNHDDKHKLLIDQEYEHAMFRMNHKLEKEAF